MKKELHINLNESLITSKVKVKQSLYLIMHHVKETYGERVGMAPHINLGIKRR